MGKSTHVEEEVAKPDHGHKWMPVMYTIYYGMLKEKAQEHGYACAVHGSLTRDMDLILVPWTEDARPVLDLLNAWYEIIGDLPRPDSMPYTSKGIKPHGRVSYTIPVGAGGYIDVSVVNGI